MSVACSAKKSFPSSTLKRGLLGLLSLTSLCWPAGCSLDPREASATESTEGSSDLADQRWLEKASRALRFGKGLAPNDPLRSYVNRPKSEAIEVLFKDPLFFPTMMDFYSYYFGFKSNDGVSKKNPFLKLSYDPNTRNLSLVSTCANPSHCVDYQSYYLNRQLFNHVATITGAVSVVEGRSIEDLYRPVQPANVALSAMADFASTLVYASMGPSTELNDSNRTINLDKTRSKFVETLDLLNRVIGNEIARKTSDSYPDLCQKIEKNLGDRLNLLLSTLGSVVEYPLICPPNARLSLAQAQKLRREITKLRSTVGPLFQFIDDFLAKRLKLRHETYFEVPESLEGVWKKRLYGDTFWTNHLNSSTNYNRRRAAYILKTFFCDDLTPVKLEIAKNPGDNRHASDPSCMACHYKLDPLAGFFRFHGASGIKFDASQDFYFDDLKKISGQELEAYLETWDFPGKNGPNQGLNVGLIRSATDPSKNSYGSTLEDLGRLVAKDPRTYLCQTQRLADYFIGGGITYDPKWLEQLSSQISATPLSSNGNAVKGVIKSLLLSKSFMTGDPVEGVCYDRASGTDPQSKLDCLVESTLGKYCVKCHGRDSSNGNLDLTSWSANSGFKHQDGDGKSYSIKESYGKIIKRLGPSSDGPMMPLNSPMPDPDRRILLNWFEKNFQSSK